MLAPESSFYQCNFFVNVPYNEQYHQYNNYYYGNGFDNGYTEAMEVEENNELYYEGENNVLYYEGENNVHYEENNAHYEEPKNAIYVNDNIVRQNPLLNQQVYFTALSRTFYLINIAEHSKDYESISSLFYATMRNAFKITHIDRIDSPYLYGAYLLKKEQLVRRNPGNWQELMLFHGTKRHNVNDICKHNFNWRLCRSGTGRHRFGQGVSFSPSASYATHYCDNGRKKVMLLCNVLVKNKCFGHHNMVLPDYQCDTSVNETEQVVVKYEDNEFYPLYKICFTNTDNYTLLKSLY